jgi:thiamine-phosphate pyrophosphorylase
MNLKGFYFITDSALTKRDVIEDVKAAIRGGAKVVQYREKSKDTGPMAEEAKRLKEICKGKALFLINDRVDVALAVDADGVHLGQTDMPYGVARRLLGDKMIGMTVHSLREAKEAEAMGADYVGLSPIFATATKSDAGKAVGLRALKEVCDAVSIPVVAIGGITLENAGDVMEAGATTLCAISATVGDDVEKRVGEFMKIIKNNART